MTAPVTYTREQMVNAVTREADYHRQYMPNGEQELTLRAAAATLRQAAAEGQGKHSDACCELTYREMDQRCICAATPTEPTPPPAVGRCKTCQHWDTGDSQAIAHCRKGNAAMPFDGSGLCHLHEAAK